MNTSLVYLRPVSLAYIRVKGPYSASIPQAWEQMFNWLDKHGLNTSHGRGFGLARDNPAIVGSEACRYDACVALTPQLEHRAARELGIITMPGGSFSRIRKTGCYENARDLVSGIFSSYTPPPGLHLDVRRPLVTIYLDDPREFSPSDQRMELCVPVTALANPSARNAQRAVA